MEAGEEREALTRFADRLCAELGYSEGEPVAVPTPATALGEPLDPEEEQLIAAVSQILARIAAAVGAGDSEGIADTAIRALLGGAEVVMRSELIKGRPIQLTELIPSFVFLVTLPLVDHDEAQALAERASVLLEQALGD
jgi:hypothetical protein